MWEHKQKKCEEEAEENSTILKIERDEIFHKRNGKITLFDENIIIMDAIF